MGTDEDLTAFLAGAFCAAAFPAPVFFAAVFAGVVRLVVAFFAADFRGEGVFESVT